MTDARGELGVENLEVVYDDVMLVLRGVSPRHRPGDAGAAHLRLADGRGVPAGSGDYGAGADKGAVRVTTINKPDKNAPTGVTEVQKLTAGPTATGFSLTKACYK